MTENKPLETQQNELVRDFAHLGLVVTAGQEDNDRRHGEATSLPALSAARQAAATTRQESPQSPQSLPERGGVSRGEGRSENDSLAKSAARVAGIIAAQESPSSTTADNTATSAVVGDRPRLAATTDGDGRDFTTAGDVHPRSIATVESKTLTTRSSGDEQEASTGSEEISRSLTRKAVQPRTDTASVSSNSQNLDRTISDDHPMITKDVPNHALSDAAAAHLKQSGNSSIDSTDVSIAPAVTHETVHVQNHEIRQEVIHKEIHEHHEVTRILPVIDRVVLPARHFIQTPDGRKFEIPAPDAPAG